MKRIFLKSLLLSLFVGLGFYLYYSLPDVSELKQKNPKTTALMELRDGEYRKKHIRAQRQHIWVAYGAVSEHLKRAILISEDAAFFNHRGVDMNEIQAALKKDWETRSFSRGGSTITMQLARNLYLSPSKNPLRKAEEIMIAWQLERTLTKQRIFEIYLNVAELGKNIYGAEAAARSYFGKSAAALDAVEAATLAALLPNPRTSRDKNLLGRRNLILNRLTRVGYLSAEEYQRGRQLPLFPKLEQAESMRPKQNL